MTIVLTVLLAVLKFVGWLLLFLLAVAGSPANFAGGAAVCLSGWQTIADRLVRPAAFYALGHGPLPKINGCTASRRAATSARSTTQALNQRCPENTACTSPQPLLRNPREASVAAKAAPTASPRY